MDGSGRREGERWFGFGEPHGGRKKIDLTEVSKNPPARHSHRFIPSPYVSTDSAPGSGQSLLVVVQVLVLVVARSEVHPLRRRQTRFYSH